MKNINNPEVAIAMKETNNAIDTVFLNMFIPFYIFGANSE